MKKIKSIEVKNSRFYQDFRLEFSDKLNCIMGGRGTGKTTLLNFIRVALGHSDSEDRQLNNLLRSNLGAGTITLEIQTDDNLIYNVVKTLDEPPQPYALPKLNHIPISAIMSEIECDFYEAGRIEEIGRSSKDRLNLVDKKIKKQVAEYVSAIVEIQNELESNAIEIKSINRKMLQFEDVMNQYANVDEEIEAHKEQIPKEIGEDANIAFEEADRNEGLRRQESRFYNRSIDLLKKVQRELIDTTSPLRDFSAHEIESVEKFQNQELMHDAQQVMLKTIDEIRYKMGSVHSYIQTQLVQFDQLFNNLMLVHNEQQANFIKMKQKFEQSREYINKYNLLSKRITEKHIIQKDKEDISKKLDAIKHIRAQLLNRLNELKKEIFRLRLETIRELNAGFKKEVVITLTHSGIKDEFQNKLRMALKGSGLQYNQLVQKISERFTPDQFARVIHDRNANTLMSIKEIDIQRAKSVISALYETDLIYEIEAMYCDDLPEFKLKIADDAVNVENNYRRTDELSMGQRCTTVLPIIFAVSTNPLIIDQPEDNLDNKYITQSIHETIREQKENRQLIFITHNPNIPVLSDADHNVFFEYESRKSSILHEGSIDGVKQDIINLLEGGEDAFKRRMEIYGYDQIQKS